MNSRQYRSFSIITILVSVILLIMLTSDIKMPAVRNRDHKLTANNHQERIGADMPPRFAATSALPAPKRGNAIVRLDDSPADGIVGINLLATIAANKDSAVTQPDDDAAGGAGVNLVATIAANKDNATLQPDDSATDSPKPDFAPITTAAQGDLYYVAPDGSDDEGNGSEANPWATISRALENVPDGSTILVRPGTYVGHVDLKGSFAQGVTVRSEVPYQARLRHRKTVVTCFQGQGITLEGFDIAHSGPDAGLYVIQLQDLRGERSGGDDLVSRIVLRNNVLHDSYHNDIIKANRGVGQIIIEGNIFYNQAGPDSHIDANSVTDVIIQDNIFFNDFGGSGRINGNDTGSYIVIKDSNEDKDMNIGSRNVIVRRNIFLNWEGLDSNTFIVVGEDAVSYYQAYEILIENNLMLGNSNNTMRAAFGVKGSRNVTFRHNTIVGNMPAKAYAMRLNTQDNNLNNKDIYFYNNIWSDPTGTMGANPSDSNDFSDTPPDETDSFILDHNLYWNGGEDIPYDEDELVNYTDDAHYVMDNPRLADQSGLILPRWLPNTSQFADGSRTIRQAFERLVTLYGLPAQGSPVIDAADPAHAPDEDIWGHPRPAGSRPDIGAYERQR